MQIILLKDVEKLGLRGDVVDVARGYARNYLLPRRLAEVATPARVAESRRVDEQRARHEARSAEQAHDIAEILNKTVLTFEVKSGPTGSLFGSVTPSDVVDEIWRTRKIRVDRRKVETDPIKRIGRYAIPIEVFEDVRVEVKTLVVPEGGELRPEEVLAALEAFFVDDAATTETEAATEHEEAEAAIAEVIAEEEPEVDAPDAEAAAEAKAAPEAETAPEADATTEDEAAPEDLEPADEPALTAEPADEPADETA
jgi:large subunit ribosomal protein L9